MFFQTLFQMMTPGLDYSMTVSRTEAEITVIVLPKANGLKDTGQAHLVPFVMTAAPAEVDMAFFPALHQPIINASKVLSNMADFEKGAKEAAANSKAEKEKKDKDVKDAKTKGDKYQKFFEQAEEQVKAGKLEEALTSWQQARLHGTEKEIETVDEKIASLKEKLSQGTLFDVPAAAAKNEPQVNIPEAGASAEPPRMAVQAPPYAAPQNHPQPGVQTPPPGYQGYPYPYPEYGQQPYPGQGAGPQQQGYPQDMPPQQYPPHGNPNGWQPPMAGPACRENEYEGYIDFSPVHGVQHQESV